MPGKAFSNNELKIIVLQEQWKCQNILPYKVTGVQIFVLISIYISTKHALSFSIFHSTLKVVKL